jgi:autotransporter-associated beta strand protein
MFSPPVARAAAPDLTGEGVIAALKADPKYSSRPYDQTYSLGATGLRGWIYINSADVGADGLITAESRQILVTVAEAPASAVLAVDDLILGAVAGSTGDVPSFSGDCRKAFGIAVGDAEKTGAGTLRVKRWRAGVITYENFPMAIMGNYTATAPNNCSKSALILTNARLKMVSDLKANTNYLSYGYIGAINGLALLASVAPGDADYALVQTRLKSFTDGLVGNSMGTSGMEMWDWSYINIYLSEYYLRTVADGAPDASVLAGINRYTVAMAKGQSRYGTFSHGVTPPKFDGSLHGTVTPYGPVNAVGIPGNIAIVIGKKALVAGGQTIDPEIDPAIQRASDFLGYYVNKGGIPYGEHEPVSTAHASNGKDAMCAVLFGLQNTRPAEAEYFARMTVAGCTGREYGHTGQGLSYLWGAVGANMGGPTAIASYMENIRWHNDLARRTDGSFAYDGQEQYGAGSTADGSYLGRCSYAGIDPTATYVLSYGVSLQRLYLTGKDLNPSNALSIAKVDSAIAAATYKQDCIGLTTTQLLADLSAYDPVVRNYAAIQLGTRTLSSTELKNLIDSITNGTLSSNPSTRMGACQALGARRATEALTALGQRLSDTDLWVRGKAAQALRLFNAADISTQRDTMLTAFVANATDPEVIVWNDPVQIANNYLSFAIFGDSVYGGGNIASYTIDAPKNLLYPAVKAGLKQPDSNPRLGVCDFANKYLTLADSQALTPDLFAAATSEALADTMWHGEARAAGIKAVAKFKPAEAISIALSMMNVEPGYGWGAQHFQNAALNVMNSFGDAARWTLPALRQYALSWDPGSDQYPLLNATIASIEAAITSPDGIINLLAVASPQVVVTPVSTAKPITLTGTTPRGALTYSVVTTPIHGTLSGTAPNLFYTPTAGYIGPDRLTFKVVDSVTTSQTGTVSIIVGAAGAGLKGEYFDNINYTNPKLTRVDPEVNFDWGTGSPDPTIGADTFSVRWSGQLLVPETGSYVFSTLNSDGTRLFINGIPVINEYADHSTSWKDGTPINLTAGQRVELQMEYYQNIGSAVAKLKWRGPTLAGMNGSIISKEWLYDGTGITNRLAYAHAQSVTLIQNASQAITLMGSGVGLSPLTYSVITQPAHGILTGVSPNLTYTPEANYSGSDSFTFLVNNGFSNSSPASVSIGIWSSSPTSYFWTNAVAGNWSGASWSNAAGSAVTPAAAGNASYNLNFNQSGTYTTTHDLNNNYVFNQLNLAASVTLDGTNSLSPTINGSLLPQINQNSANAVSINTPINLSAMTTFGGVGGGPIYMPGAISGLGGVNKDGPGTLQIHGITANSFSGGTIVNGGTLHLGAFIDGQSIDCVNPLGTGPVTLNSGGTIQFDRVNANNVLTANGGTLFSGNGWGAAWTGPIVLNATVMVNTPFTLYCSGAISGAGGFTKMSGGPLIITGNNSSTGTNQIIAGTLQCDTASSLGSGPLNITNGANVNLNYSGSRTIAALSYNGGAPLAPGTYGSSSSPATNKNSNYFSGPGTITVLPVSNVALALSSGNTPSNVGVPLTFTATVTGSAPTGNVAFYAGNTWLGDSALNGLFKANFTTSSLEVGSYSVTAKYAGNASNAASNSSVLAIEITSQLAATPTNLVATAGHNTVGLTWSVSSGATGYKVKRANARSGPYVTISSVNTARYDDLSAKNGSIYYYVVSAVNGIGESANSSSVVATVGLSGLSVTSGLVLRMDASQITGTSDGSQLDTWTDTSGAANNAVRQSGSSSGYPKYVASGINGQPVVRFNSASPNAGDYFQFDRISTIRTVFWVMKENAGLADSHFLLGDSNNYDFHRAFTPNGPLWDATYSSANIRNGTTKLMGNTVDGTTTSLPSGSFKLVSLVTNGNVSANQICQDRAAHGSWQGDIAEILIYDRALTGDEENQVGYYLGNKYGLTTNYKALPVSSGLVLRMDASQITGTADGAQLDTWTDTSGAQNNADRQGGSSTGYPKYVASGINGKPAVRFNSGNNSAGDFLKFNRITNMRSVFWVLKENAGLVDSHFLLGDDSYYQFHRGGNNGPLWDSNYADVNIRNGVTKLMGNPIDGTTTSLPSGSFQMVSLVTTDNVQANQICQDRNAHGSWQGDIAEILVYDRAVTGPEETAIGTYLATKYGLATNYPVSATLQTPTGVAALPLSSGAITLSWSPVSGASSYNVWSRNTQTNAVQLVSTNVPSFAFAGLAGGVPYEFKVSATNSNGVTGSYSSSVTAASLLSTACDIVSFAIPGQISSAITGSTITVTVASGTSVTALAPVYTASPAATGNPASGSIKNFNTPQTYTITAENGTSKKVYTVTVRLLNNAPVASSQNLSTVEGNAKPITLIANDADGNPLTYIVLTMPANGTLSGTAPNLVYNPAANFNGTDSFTFKANDGSLDSAVATVAITVTSATLTWNTGIAGNWSDGSKWLAGTSPASVGLAGYVLNFNAAGVYTAINDLSSGFQLNRINFGGSTATLGGNTLALVNNGSTLPQLNQNSANTVTLSTNLVLNANTNLGGSGSGALTLSGIISGGSGLTKTTAGNLTLAGQNTYSGGTSVSNGSLTIANQNALGSGALTLAAGSLFQQSTFEGNSPTGALPNAFVLNGSVTMNLPFSQKDVWLSQPVSGIGGMTVQGGNRSLTLTANNTFSGGLILKDFDNRIQISHLNALGTGTFRTERTTGGSEGKLITLSNLSTGLGVQNAVDIAANAYLNVFADGTNHLLLSGPITSAVGVGHLYKTGTAKLTLSGANTYSGTTTVAAGTLDCSNLTSLGIGGVSIGSGAKLGLNFTGTRQIASLSLAGVTQPNGSYGSSASPALNKNDAYFTGTGTVTVGPLNTAPVATNQNVITAEDTSKSISLTATDVDGNPLTYSIVSAPTSGTLSGTAPNLIYSPGANYNGADSFTFKANDGTLDSNVATVTINVTPVNDAPVAIAQSASTPEDVGKVITLTAGDLDSVSLTYVIVTPPTKGTLSGAAPNLTYTPTANYNGADSFTFKANDGSLDSAAATVSITVTPVNDAPVATAQSVSTAEDTAKAIALSASDVDGDPLTYIIVSSPAHGALSGTGSNLTYTPTTNYNGADSFTFKANDGLLDSAVATVTITLSAVNDAPVFTVNPIIAAAGVEGSDYIGQTLNGRATDVDTSDSITYSKVSGPAWLVVAANGTLSGTPTLGSAGLNSFVVRATDSASATADAGLQITVTALPLPWLTGNLGTGALVGSATYSAGTFSVAGSGTFGGTSDKLRFIYQGLSGDGEIIAKISALQDTGTSSRVGVMIRDSLATNSMHVFMGMSSANAFRMVRRTTTGGSATASSSSTGTVPNTWVRLVRVGNVITAYKGLNGTTWTSVGSTTVTMATNCYIGLAVSSGSDSTLNSSQFSNLSVTP